jgi:hypothetical protein
MRSGVVFMAATIGSATGPAQPQWRVICTGTACGLDPVYWLHGQPRVPVGGRVVGTEFAMAASELLYRHVAATLALSIPAGTLVRGERVPSVRGTTRHRSVSVATAAQAYRASTQRRKGSVPVRPHPVTSDDSGRVRLREKMRWHMRIGAQAGCGAAIRSRQRFLTCSVVLNSGVGPRMHGQHSCRTDESTSSIGPRGIKP